MNSEELTSLPTNIFELLSSSTSEAIVIADDCKEIVYCNGSANFLFGYNTGELVGKDLAMLIPHGQTPLNQDLKQRRSQLGTFDILNEVVELEGIRNRGTVIPLEVSISKWEQEEQVWYCLIIRDISKRKEIEENLLRKKTEYKTLLNQAYIGIAKVNLDGTFIKVNDHLCQMLGYEAYELVDNKFQKITHPDDLSKSLEIRQMILEGVASNVTLEKRYVHKSGAPLDVNVTINLVRNESDKPLYFVVVVEDVTEQKRNQQLIEQSLYEKEVLLKEIHHRVKNNMQLISSLFNLYSAKWDDENTSKALMECQSMIHSMALVHQSLYHSDKFASLKFEEYVDQLCDYLQTSLIVNKNIRLVKNLSNVNVSIHKAVSCGLILNELLTNAFKHAFKEEEKGVIEVHLKGTEEGASLIISDNGKGMDERFSLKQPDTFGMELVLSLVEQIDGSIEYEKAEGSKFIVNLTA